MEDALLLAAMGYIDDYLYRQRQKEPAGGVACPLTFCGAGLQSGPRPAITPGMKKYGDKGREVS